MHKETDFLLRLVDAISMGGIDEGTRAFIFENTGLTTTCNPLLISRNVVSVLAGIYLMIDSASAFNMAVPSELCDDAMDDITSCILGGVMHEAKKPA